MKECLFCEGDCTCGTKRKKSRTSPLDKMKARSQSPSAEKPRPLAPEPPVATPKVRSVSDPFGEAVRVLAFNGLLSQEAMRTHASHLAYKKPEGRLLDGQQD